MTNLTLIVNVHIFFQKFTSSLKIQKAEAHALYKCTTANKIGEDSRIIVFSVTREDCAFPSLLPHLELFVILRPFCLYPVRQRRGEYVAVQ